MPISSFGRLVDKPNDVPIAGIIPSIIAPPGYINTKPHVKYIMHAIE